MTTHWQVSADGQRRRYDLDSSCLQVLEELGEASSMEPSWLMGRSSHEVAVSKPASAIKEQKACTFSLPNSLPNNPACYIWALSIDA